MASCCTLQDLCEYETTRSVRIKSVRLGLLKWIIHGIIFLCICGMLLWDKCYQDTDSVLSSVTTKVKGVAKTEVDGLNGRIWDVADYSAPVQGKNSFFVMTNLIITENQRQGFCPEYPTPVYLTPTTTCNSDKDCEKGRTVPQGNGFQTGKCIQYQNNKKSCEIHGWCPVEKVMDAPRPAVLKSSENFTVLVKNSIKFPKFQYTRRNILPNFNESYLKKCRFHHMRDPYCPVFRLGAILEAAKENFSDMAIEGGVMAIQINWDCNLDKWNHKCEPKYSFHRLDNRNVNETLSPGYNFRFARYYKFPNGTEERTLIKAYGIRFDVLVSGKAGKFDIIELIIYIGSTLSYYGLTALLIDLFITTYIYPCCHQKNVKEYYVKKIYKDVQKPKRNVFYISHVDEAQIDVVEGPLKSNLQEAKRKNRLEYEAGQSHLTASLAQHFTAENELEMQPSRNKSQTSAKQPTKTPSWCHCGKCHPMPSYEEQLCCRKSDGECITQSSLFGHLVLSRTTLEFSLLYREPLLTLHQEINNNKLRHISYKQYISWRFGALQALNAAVIPSCSIWEIRNHYPSIDGHYTGLHD
ncbi:P2X purinoceptor 7 [Protopterus annectens]|uniref:P2X purinoceptor 7 n=1 Tax=Protopterus annectens TaxID=7888 RepID=UPI001CFA11F3|nr:P2X purinoceptor 7 [Protopterus annectens]